MLILKDLNDNYLIRAALYDSAKGSCIEIICHSSDPEKLGTLLTEGLRKALQGSSLTSKHLSIYPVL